MHQQTNGSLLYNENFPESSSLSPHFSFSSPAIPLHHSTTSFGKPESKFLKIFVKLEKQAFISCVKNHRSGGDLEVDEMV